MYHHFKIFNEIIFEIFFIQYDVPNFTGAMRLDYGAILHLDVQLMMWLIFFRIFLYHLAATCTELS